MTNNSPLVSAVIPVYNGERFLAETIESVLAQTYKNIECIVVNDGSTDGTAEICRSYGDRIRYFEKPNGGVSSARNLGIANANGELIAFLDADDLWKAEKIEQQVALFEQDSNVGLLYSSVRIIDEKGAVISLAKVDFAKDPLARILLLESPVYLTMTGLVPRTVLDRVGSFDERLSTSADADLACRIALRYPLKHIEEPLADYRKHNGQMHLNLTALEHDATMLFNKVFFRQDLPEKTAGIRSAAFANLECALAIGHIRNGNYWAGLLHLFRGMRHNLPAAGRKLSRNFRGRN